MASVTYGGGKGAHQGVTRKVNREPVRGAQSSNRKTAGLGQLQDMHVKARSRGGGERSTQNTSALPCLDQQEALDKTEAKQGQ